MNEGPALTGLEERIVAAAVMAGDVIVSVPPPGRHHTVLNTLGKRLSEMGVKHPVTLWGEQGFTTSLGRFVGRAEGFRIAEAARQIVEKHGPPDTLFSEDMW